MLLNNNSILHFAFYSFILDSKLAIKPDDVVDFSTNGCEWKGKYCGNHVRVKRLSTKSSVLAAEDDNNEDKEEESIVGFTEWKWYWQTDDKSWKEYDGTVIMYHNDNFIKPADS